MHCPRYISGFSGMQGICAQWTGEGHMKCNGIQCIYAWLTGRSICLLYICIVLDLAVGVVVGMASVLNWPGRATWNVTVFKASILDWLGVHLPSIYMHCPRSSSGCSSMTRHLCSIDWGTICLLYIGIVLDLAVGVVVCKTSMLDWLGLHLPSIYMHCPRSSSGCSSIMQGIYAWLTGKGHRKCNGIQGIYTAIIWLQGHLPSLYMHFVLDLALGVVICMASVLNWLGRVTWSVMVFNAYMLDWLGGPSAFFIYALS